MAALSFDDLIYEVGTDVSVPFEFEGVPDDLFELGNPLCDNVQVTVSGKSAETSPFHQSDSGMSEDFDSDSVLGSPAAGREAVNIVPGNMLDDLVDAMDVEPFCQGADKDLSDYFGGMSPDSDSDMFTMKTNFETQSSVSDYSNPSSPEYIPPPSRSHGGKLRRLASILPKVIGPQGRPTPAKSESSNVTASSAVSKIKSIKVLRVIKTTGSADTASEVLQALDDRNKKNAVHAKMNRQRKKQYIACLEEKVGELTTQNGQLKSENGTLKTKFKVLEDEVEYLRAVLANDSNLSKLLSNIGSVKNIRLSSVIGSRKRNADHDHSYVPSKKVEATAGVCLHVDNDTVSLEFCSTCSSMAKAGAT